MKKLIFSSILGFSLLLSACTDPKEKLVNDETDGTKQSVSQNSYTNEYGQFEIITQKKKLNFTETADNISLTLQSIEQGKVKLTDDYAPNYENLIDDDGYVSYLKAHMKIDAPVDELTDAIRFYPYQAIIHTNTGHATQSESTLSDKVSIQHHEPMQLEGDIYFLLGDQEDFQHITIKVLAPFNQATNLSIGENLAFTIDLTEK